MKSRVPYQFYTAFQSWFLRSMVLVSLVFLTQFTPASSQNNFSFEPVQIDAQNQNAFGRIVVTFTERFDLPAYEVGWDNGVLVITFDNPINTSLVEVTEKLSDYVSAARLDPDQRGIRIGLNGEFKLNKTEAGESIFIDLLPAGWQGVEPGLPKEVVEELSRRSRVAAAEAEQRRKAMYVRENQPGVEVRVGRHERFIRLLLNWDIEVEGVYTFAENLGELKFDWPVTIDLHDLQSQLPPEILSVENSVDESGSQILMTVAEGVEPRFYSNSSREYIIDVDLQSEKSEDIDLAELLVDSEDGMPEAIPEGLTSEMPDQRSITLDVPEDSAGVSIKPFMEQSGSTVRLVFPFERDTAAAVFRRGKTLWMVFDTKASIGAPDAQEELAELASTFSVQPAGDTSIVRLNLESDRLATMGSEGRSWVLSLGDVLLTPGELIALSRRQTAEGLFEMIADLDRAANVHQLRDPDVGDVLEVVTAFPPSRGIVRELEHVDFSALRSMHGLVVKPLNDDVEVRVESRSAVISSPRGLILSTPQLIRGADQDAESAARNGFIELADLEEPDPAKLNDLLQELMLQMSILEKRELDQVRLNAAQFFLANRFSFESLGLLNVLEKDLVSDALETDLQMTRAAASAIAGRWQDAITLLNSKELAGKADGMIWSTIARAGMGDYRGARQDSLAAELSIDKYPHWVRERFLIAASEAAIEQDDIALANRYIGLVQTAYLDAEALSRYELIAGRLDHAAGRLDEALETFGRVISAEVRPTRAEAIYRTMLLLDEMDRLDTVRAADTLASEVLVWRGNQLEAKMLKFLAELYFRNDQHREAFDTVRSLAAAHPDEETTRDLLDEAKLVFADLYLNGQADGLPPVDALTLYYDFRNMTPAGARGDEMVRNLARRLIKVDLLTQASELLQYQIDNRLEGAARAQIAADLAVVYLAERKPQKALQALNDTRFSGITPSIERQRRVLEARALIDAGREDLALDILAQLDGRDADLLRVDAHWRAKRYQDAGETLELLYGSEYGLESLSQAARMNVVKAAVGFVLANDDIGVSRLRQRFSETFSQTPEWPLFDFVTSRVEMSSLEFQKVAEEIADADSLNAFLTTYRDIYGGDGALSPKNTNI